MRIEDRHRIQNANAAIQLLGLEQIELKKEIKHLEERLGRMRVRAEVLPALIEEKKRHRDYIVQQVEEGGEERERQEELKHIERRLKELAKKKLTLKRQSE